MKALILESNIQPLLCIFNRFVHFRIDVSLSLSLFCFGRDIERHHSMNERGNEQTSIQYTPNSREKNQKEIKYLIIYARKRKKLNRFVFTFSFVFFVRSFGIPKIRRATKSSSCYSRFLFNRICIHTRCAHRKFHLASAFFHPFHFRSVENYIWFLTFFDWIFLLIACFYLSFIFCYFVSLFFLLLYFWLIFIVRPRSWCRSIFSCCLYETFDASTNVARFSMLRSDGKFSQSCTPLEYCSGE